MPTVAELEKAFAGRLTASATHEFRNILAIVKESAGLIEDLVMAAQQGRPLDRERIQQAVGRIEAQVNRGAELAGALNRLAHGLDGTVGAVDLRQHVQEVAVLGQRLVRQRERKLRVRPGVEPLSVTANALRVQRMLTAAVECCAEQVPAGGVVVLSAEWWRDRPAVRLTGEVGEAGESVTVGLPSGGECGGLREAVQGLGAALEADPGHGFLVVFPVARSR